MKTFEPDKAIEVAEKMEARRGIEMSDIDKRILLHVYRSTLKNKKLR